MRAIEMRRWILRFTLVELLVVIAIIAILAAMLLPALGKARNLGKRAVCQGNLKQFGVAISSYVDDWQGWLPIDDAASNMRVKALLSSYLGIPNISGTSDVRLAKGVYRCPSWVNKSSLGSAAQSGYAWNYSYLGYESGAWPVPQVKLAQVRRPSETIDFADTLDQEATGYGICNYLMMTYPNQAAVFSPNLSVGERHALGGDYLWLDAHVSWISARTAMVGKNGDGNYCYKVVK